MHKMQQTPPFEELEAFVAVATEGNFRSAGRALERDPSIISKRVKQLEERLQVSLLSRTTRHVSLTEAGEMYLARVRSVLEELRDANRSVADLAATPRGTLKISLPNTFGRRCVVPILPKFLSNNPEIRLDVRFSDRYVDLVAEGYDATLRLGVKTDSTLKAVRLATYRHVLAASPGYLKQHGTPKAPTDLQSHACLGFLGHSFWPDWPLAWDGSYVTFKPQGPLVSDSSELLHVAALQDRGIVLAADWLVRHDIESGALVEVLPGWAGGDDYDISVVLPPDRLVPAKTRAFIDELAGYIRKNWLSAF